MKIGSNSLIILSLLLLLLISCGQRSIENESRKEQPNRLAASGSPYLREHADNPVDWYEWGSEALEKAKKENKPLIISIGYSSCHWCHVMERESFMDTAVARLMNENFISIKIDREERPDIDQIYLNAAQLISGNAGWPLNAFALPDGRPFYAATYFPKDQWIKMLMQIKIAYQKENSNVIKQAAALTKGIQTHDVITLATNKSIGYNRKIYTDFFKSWEPYLDFESGGLSGSPKFPMPAVWEFLLQYHYLTENKKALEIVSKTLDAMARGGIYDQIGGGFARYSTDSYWKVPHFEKMLYDNGQLVSLYAHAFQQTKKPLYKEIIFKTLQFIERELTSPEGGFYSSLNADSENEEGKYYLWTKTEIKNILANKTADLIIDYYQVTDSGNWERKKNILHIKIEKEEFAMQHDLTTDEFSNILTEAENHLLQERTKRIPPSRDDKILTAWNALMLQGFTDAYFATGNENYLKTSLKNARFLEKNMVREDGRLWRSYKDGKAGIDAFLDDYALLARSFIRLYEATFDIHWLETARSISEYAIAHFRDKQSGLFYYTSDDAENLVARKMELADNVIPSSNSVLADVLYRLGEYYGQDSYIEMSKSMLNQIVKNSNEQGQGLYYANWSTLMGLITHPPYEVAIIGEQAREKNMQLHEHYLPHTIFIGGTSENLPLLENKYVEGKTIIYVCRDKVCKLPVQDVEKALQQLNTQPLRYKK